MLRGLAQYRVLRQLGQGGQARVLLAIDTRLQRRVAIKLFDLPGSLAQRRHARAEARHLARLDSDRIVRIHDVVSSGHALALIEQYVPGCDLAELLRDGQPLALPVALGIVTDVAAALAVAHRAGIVHGDVKPSNVLLDGRGRATLCDFGIAGAGNTEVGYSREAISAEQYAGHAATRQTDLYALGLLLYRMLFLAHPFFSGDRLDSAKLMRGVQGMPDPPGLSDAQTRDTRVLLESLLAPDPKARPESTVEVRHRLRDLRRSLPPPAPLEDRVLRCARDDRRSRNVPRLPKRLVRLPWQQHVATWLQALWRGGSAGARIVFATSGSLAAVAVLLYVLRPGPCVSIRPVELYSPSAISRAVPGAAVLGGELLSVLRKGASRATILGTVPGSDSVQLISDRRVRDRCIADRSVRLRVDCDRLDCLLGLRAERGDEVRTRQLRLPVSSGLRGFRTAVRELAMAQRAFLLRD